MNGPGRYRNQRYEQITLVLPLSRNLHNPVVGIDLSRFCCRNIFAAIQRSVACRRYAIRENERMSPPCESYETSMGTGKGDKIVIWTKEVPVKPGKYIARHKDEDTGRTRYLDATVGELGSTPFFRGIPHKYLCDIYGRVEYSKRVGNVE